MSRALIFMFDGTSMDAAEIRQFNPTNIYQLNMLIEPSRVMARKRHSQVSFYFPGIGSSRESSGSLSKWTAKLFGVGIYGSVCRAYVNLCSNFRKGDELSIFGFSRGAVAARVLARIVSDFGVLRANSLSLTEKLMQKYETAVFNPSDYASISADFVRSYSKEIQPNVNVKFLGLFDCVSGPGDTEINDDFFSIIDATLPSSVDSYLHLLSLHDVRREFVLRLLRVDSGRGREVWMPGTHGDLGGGQDTDFFSNLALLTMSRDIINRGKLALCPKQMKVLEQSVALGIQKEAFVVTKEGTPRVLEKKARDEYFKHSPEQYVHAVNKRLVGRLVRWKDQDAIGYEDRVASFLEDKESETLMKDFADFWSQ